MIGVPSSVVLSRPSWFEALVRRMAARWLRRHDPRTLALKAEIETKLADQTSWLDRFFPPPPE